MRNVFTLIQYLSATELNHIVLMALDKKVRFSQIKKIYKITESELDEIMKFQLDKPTYIKWKKIKT